MNGYFLSVSRGLRLGLSGVLWGVASVTWSTAGLKICLHSSICGDVIRAPQYIAKKSPSSPGDEEGARFTISLYDVIVYMM